MDIFTLSAKLMLDSSAFDRGINDAEKKGSSLASKLSGGLARAGSVASAALISGITASAGAISSLAKSSVGAFAEFEQLVGGVETLFKNGADTVMKNAKEAYMTAGVDMNSYMQTAINSSASLLQSLEGDYERAAELTDMAIVDMSDNANKMGSDLGMVQNAYAGFARQNFMMLDNLHLGYQGTRTEMQRLLKDAGKLTGKKYDISNLADIYEAIHAIQEQMGITGTTAEEAATTIEGSTRMMRAAWQNLKIAFTNPNANINDAISKFIDTTKIAIKNVIPAFSNAVKGIGTAIKEIVPIISAELPAVFKEVLPGLLSGGVTLVSGIVQGIVDNLPLIGEAASAMVAEIVRVFQESDNPVLNLIGDGLSVVQQAFQWIIDNKEIVVTAIGAIVAAFAVAEIAGLAANLNPVVLAIEGIAAAAALVIANWDSIKADWDQLWADLGSMVSSAWESVKLFFTNIIGQISEAWSAVSGWFEENVTKPVSEFFSSLFDSIKQIWDGTKQSISQAWATISGWFEGTVTKPLSTLFDSVFGAIQQIWDGISTKISEAWSAVEGVLAPILKPIKDLFQGVVDVVSKIWDTLTDIFNLGDKNINVNVKYNSSGDPLGIGAKNGGELPESIQLDPKTHQPVKPDGFAKGSRYVPYDMTARIHRGEEILTPSQARQRNNDEMNYEYIGYMIGEAVESAIGRVGVYMSGERVADITAKRMQGNINANSRSVLKAMGG